MSFLNRDYKWPFQAHSSFKFFDKALNSKYWGYKSKKGIVLNNSFYHIYYNHSTQVPPWYLMFCRIPTALMNYSWTIFSVLEETLWVLLIEGNIGVWILILAYYNGWSFVGIHNDTFHENTFPTIFFYFFFQRYR